MVIAYFGTNLRRGVFYSFSVIFILFVCELLSNVDVFVDGLDFF